jgi:hypothetical protein
MTILNGCRRAHGAARPEGGRGLWRKQESRLIEEEGWQNQVGISMTGYPDGEDGVILVGSFHGNR